MATKYNQHFNETDIKITQRAYEFYLKEYPSILRQDFGGRSSSLLGKNKKALLNEDRMQESRINVFRESISHNHLRLALNLSETINDKNKNTVNQIVKDAIINRLDEKNVDYVGIENLIEAFKIKRNELQEDIAKTIKRNIEGEDTYAKAIDLTLYFKQDLRDSTANEISKKLLEKAADICLEPRLNQDEQRKNPAFLYEVSDKLDLTHGEVARLLNKQIKEKLKEYILFELNAQIYEPEKYKEEVLHENVKTIASIINLDANEFKSIVINTITEGMTDRLKYITNSSLKFNSYLTNVIKIAKQYDIVNDETLKDKLSNVIINSIINTDRYEEWNGSHSKFTSDLITTIDIVNIAQQHGVLDNNSLKDKVLDVIKSDELYRLESSRHWMFGYYEYDLEHYKDNSKAFEKIKTAFALTDQEVKNALSKAKKELKDIDNYFEDLEKREKAMQELKRIDARFKACANRREIVFREGSYQPMGLCQFLKTFLPL
jgi:hypothetical protein